MKNKQKGFLVPLIIVIVIIIVVLIVYMGNSKSNLVGEAPQTSSELTQKPVDKEYVSPSGLFTLKYPEDLIVQEGTTSVSFTRSLDAQNQNMIQIAAIKQSIQSYEKAFEDFAKKSIVNKESVKIGGVSADRYDLLAQETKVKGLAYVIPVKSSAGSGVIVFTVASIAPTEVAAAWMSMADSMVKSMNFTSLVTP